ncbi:hypothetical protein LOTGIDRAFT_105097, partial [Lottia gigantea]
SSYPEFTECFQHTILVWVPCAFLWLTLPVFLQHLRRLENPQPLPLGKLSICKTVLCASLSILALIDFYPYINSQVSIADAFIVSTVVKFITFILAGILCQVSRRFGLPSPCLLYLFWLFYIVANIIPFYTLIVQKVYEKNFVKFVLFYINYGILMLQLVLHSFSESTTVHDEKQKEPCPMQTASFPSKIFFMWANRLIVKGYKKPIKDEDVFDLPEEFKSKHQAPPFLNAWDKKLREERRKCLVFLYFRHDTKKEHVKSYENNRLNGDIPLLSNNERRHRTINHPAVALFIVLVKTYWFPLFKLNALRVISDLLTFINPLLLKIMITYIENRGNESKWKGYVYVAGFSLVSFTTSAIYNQSFFRSLNLAMNIKSALVAAVYRKSLTMNSDARKMFTVGAIVNLVSGDCKKLSEIVTFLWMIWSCPLQICIALYLLYQTLGVSFVAGLGVILMVIPLNSVLSTATKKIHSELLTIKDSRLKITNEVLNGIKVLKLFAWEESFEGKIMKIRQKEIRLLTKNAFLAATTIFCWIGVPVLVTLATFAMFILMSENQHLDAETAFVALSLFNILRIPINHLPMCISALINAQVSLGRLGKYLSGSDLDEKNCGHNQNTENAVEITEGTFTWDRDMPPSLKNINMKVKEGELLAVVGGVGAGKSSLLSAILGEMDKLQGQVNVKGSIAYVPQQAWIQNLSLRKNILFDGEVTKDYWQILKDCALDSDLKVLPGGESIEIGERGINLSGGQKQRVSLSRSVYSNKDIYLLDDPLSAVDTHVGKHIFKHVIGKQSILKNKTRILVTHGVHWLPLVDRIIVLDQGQITEVGSYEELLNHSGPFAQFVKTYTISEDKEEENIGSITSIHNLGELVEEEFIEEGKVGYFKFASIDIYIYIYISCLKIAKHETQHVFLLIFIKIWRIRTPSIKSLDLRPWTQKIRFKVIKSYLRHFGIRISLVTLMLFLLAQCSAVGSNIWLGIWTESNQQGNLSLYCCMNIFSALASLGYIAVLFYNMVKVSGIMFAYLLGNILRQPMNFFDTTPSGRIMNRFSKDVDILDTGLNQIFRLFMHSLFIVLSIIVVITLSTPWFLAPAVPIFIVYYFIQRFYIPTSRQLWRNESKARSPLYSHFTETITGASSIRAYSVVDKFREQSQDKMDRNNALHFASSVISRWLRMRLEVIGNITVLSASLLAVFMPGVTGSDAGLSITYALQVTAMLNQMVSVSSQLEVNVVSVERIVEYSEKEQEADWYIQDTKPKDTWPDSGEIEITNLLTKYRHDLPLVLKGLTVNFKSGEKIGIVGRTGAGKSSLSMAIFRIIESAGGSITIDGADIAKLGLHDLRTNLTILPQDPILFTGSLRMNLDPFEEHSDEELWTALEHAHLKTFVSGLPEGLNFECDEGGNNLSVGQRQLLCLARSLLRKTKILVLDEATAAVDMETDDLIQKTIRSEFKDSTVLSIAHRLNTVLDYDKILVLDNGEIIEFDSPQSLIEDNDSVFYSMAKDAKLVT